MLFGVFEGKIFWSSIRQIGGQMVTGEQNHDGTEDFKFSESTKDGNSAVE
jgi:hypothetical protein|tara:strand:+ start:4072 stop:4221 length:150 start_codon:yes stop_codon:yes gene_type:complete